MFAIALILNYLVMRVLFVFLSVVFFSTPLFQKEKYSLKK